MPRLDAQRFTVRGTQEEGPCESCGFALYSGDAAYLVEDSAVVCSKECAARSAARMELLRRASKAEA